MTADVPPQVNKVQKEERKSFFFSLSSVCRKKFFAPQSDKNYRKYRHRFAAFSFSLSLSELTWRSVCLLSVWFGWLVGLRMRLWLNRLTFPPMELCQSLFSFSLSPFSRQFLILFSLLGLKVLTRVHFFLFRQHFASIQNVCSTVQSTFWIPPRTHASYGCSSCKNRLGRNLIFDIIFTLINDKDQLLTFSS